MTLAEIRPFVRFARILRLEGGQAGFARGFAGMFRENRAQDCRLYYIIAGSGGFEAAGASHTIAHGSLAILPPGTVYRWLPDTGEPLELISVNFDYDQSHHTRRSSYMPQSPSSLPIEKCHPPTPIDDADCLNAPLWLDGMQMLESHLRDLVRERQYGDIHSEELLSHMMAQVLLLAVRRSKTHAESYLPGEERVNRVLDYIRRHYASDLSNESIAKQFNFHPNYLNRLVRQTTGQPLHRFLIQCRINAARSLLTGGMKVGDVATAVGFTDLTGFTRAFTRLTGSTPSAYAGGCVSNLSADSFAFCGCRPPDNE